MQGERSSVFKSFFFNPLVWIGIALMLFTFYNEEGHWFEVFFKAETYRNLAIGSAVYVGLFGRKYTDGMRRLDIEQTLVAVIETMLTIFLVWLISLVLLVSYRTGGETYSELLRERYRYTGNPDDTEVSAERLKSLENIKLKDGQKYKITPNEDGGVTVEVLP